MTHLDSMSDPEPSADGQLLEQCLDAPAEQRATLLAELCAAHPERATALRELHGLLEAFGLAHEPPPEPALQERIGSYRLLELLGSGGMGMVWLAEHEGLGRRVALKVLHGGLAQTEKARERFRREALAAAKLDHPSICPVYEVGRADGVPFLAMRHVPGRSLQQLVAASRAAQRAPVALPRRGSDSEQAAVLRLVEDAARALHAAHEAGLVHRDVKPGNLLVTPSGEPVLVDFGLARLEDSEGDALTLTGDQLGTPSYMAPEQVRSGVADRRTDVHALGVVLYECLTLRLPFDAPNRHELQSQILHEEAPDPRTTHRSIGRELWTVLQTAMAKEPELRYRTAAAFAEDLRRLREHEPILARRAGPWGRLVRFVRRHPVAAGVVVVLAAAFVVVLAALQQRGVALADAAAALQTANANEQALQARTAGLMSPRDGVAKALAAVEANENVETISALQAALVQDLERVRFHHAHTVWTAEFDPLGELLLTCSDDGTAKLWRLDGRCVKTIEHGMPCVWAEWSPRGDCFVTASMDATVRLLRRDGSPLHPPIALDTDRVRGAENAVAAVFDPTLAAFPWCARFSPDGSMVLVTAVDRLARVYEVATGAAIGEVVQHDGPLGLGAWSADGSVATCEETGEIHPGRERFAVRVWRPGRDGHRDIATLPMPDSAPWASFSPDGGRLVVACRDGNAWLHDLRAADPVGTRVALRHGGPVWRSEFSPDGSRIVTSSYDGTVRLFDARGEPLQVARFDGPVFETSWVADGARILATSLDNTLRVFDASLNELLVLRGHRDRVFMARMSPDGRHIASASWDHTARLWDLADARLPRLVGHTRRVRGLAALRDGTLLSIGDDRSLRRWDLRTGQTKELPIAAAPSGIALDASEGSVLLGHDDAVARRYDLATGRVLAEFVDDQGIYVSAVFLGDGTVLTSGLGTMRMQWNADGTSPRPWGTRRGARTYCLAGPTSDGLLAAAGWGPLFTIWDRGGAVLTQEPTDPAWRKGDVATWTTALAFAPAATHLAVGSKSGAVRIFVLRGGVATDPAQPRLLEPHDGRVTSVAWSADGAWFASGCTDGAARLWDARTWQLRAVLRGHRGAVNAVLFLADGRLATGGDDGAIQVWVTATEGAKAIARERVAGLLR